METETYRQELYKQVSLQMTLFFFIFIHGFAFYFLCLFLLRSIDFISHEYAAIPLQPTSRHQK